MIVPLTDSTNLYAAMMIQLINDEKPHPMSTLPRRPTKVTDNTRSRRRVVALVAATGLVLVVVASIAMRLV